jgi:hypothetical protein
MIWFLSGGSFHEIRTVVSISKPSFYRILWHAIDVINACHVFHFQFPSTLEELITLKDGFANKSRDALMHGCIGALDGFLLRIVAPPLPKLLVMFLPFTLGIIAHMESIYRPFAVLIVGFTF